MLFINIQHDGFAFKGRKENFMNDKTLLNSLISALQNAVATVSETKPTEKANAIEMLSIKESVARFKGVSESSIRTWVRQGRLPAVRAGETGRGKILINPDILRKYLNGEFLNK